MGIFADSVGELPGRAEAVRAVARDLAALKTDLDNASTTYESAPGLAPPGRGRARTPSTRLTPPRVRTCGRSSGGSTRVGSHWIVTPAPWSREPRPWKDVRIAAELLDIQWDSMSAQEKAPQVTWAENELTEWYQNHVDGVRRDAAECAAELRGALHIEAVNMQEVNGQMVNSRGEFKLDRDEFDHVFMGVSPGGEHPE